MSASGVRMTTRQIYAGWPAGGVDERRHSPGRARHPVLFLPPPCRSTTATVMLTHASWAPSSTDRQTVKPWTAQGGETAWFHVGERVTFMSKTGEGRGWGGEKRRLWPQEASDWSTRCSCWFSSRREMAAKLKVLYSATHPNGGQLALC